MWESLFFAWDCWFSRKIKAWIGTNSSLTHKTRTVYLQIFRIISYFFFQKLWVSPLDSRFFQESVWLSECMYFLKFEAIRYTQYFPYYQGFPLHQSQKNDHNLSRDTNQNGKYFPHISHNTYRSDFWQKFLLKAFFVPHFSPM